ncbi:hypothetical protein IBB80_09655 [Listeria marthii]|uniref:Uncharacterized protein n=2 Tax=Listeria marthii TaxID=529731 RepID=A0A842CPN2_9LIST|nr:MULTISPECIES: hypothetical protein [Listeria]EFR87939.1 conserved hypothetical protein [Listeria marthii FSL S4-120]MBC1970085.1 hypothetical protein [Listeria marthii]MBC1978203.1 hypothetical protein [Listeria marthii]MBC1997205.1 hypothetical protein [Listeria marthii]MBC2001381.1 hypothetical protein [Listeria marthii]
MDNCLAQLQMYDYLLKKYRNKEVFPETRMIVEIDGKLWTGDFLQLDDCHIIEIDWEDTRFTRIERTKDAINDEFNEKVTNSNVNVSENRIDSKIGSLKNIEILYQEIGNFVRQVESNTTTLKPLLYNAYCLDTRVKLPFLDISKKEITLVSLTN